MSVFTPRQRAVLKGRLSRAIAWADGTQYQRDVASRLAEIVLVEMEDSYLEAAAQRRAVVSLIEKVEAKAS